MFWLTLTMVSHPWGIVSLPEQSYLGKTWLGYPKEWFGPRKGGPPPLFFPFFFPPSLLYFSTSVFFNLMLLKHFPLPLNLSCAYLSIPVMSSLYVQCTFTVYSVYVFLCTSSIVHTCLFHFLSKLFITCHYFLLSASHSSGVRRYYVNYLKSQPPLPISQARSAILIE